MKHASDVTRENMYLLLIIEKEEPRYSTVRTYVDCETFLIIRREDMKLTNKDVHSSAHSVKILLSEWRRRRHYFINYLVLEDMKLTNKDVHSSVHI